MKAGPRARGGLFKAVLEDELVIYDPKRHRAYSLNRLTVAVWNHCDGRNSLSDLRRLAGADLATKIDLDSVCQALARLQSAGLLLEETASGAAMTRRQVLQGAGRLGSLALITPALASAFIPVAAAAASQGGLQSCRQRGSAETGCSSVNSSCVCSRTTDGVAVCINPSTALKKTTCAKDGDCSRSGYLCIPRGKAPPRCIALCTVPTCIC